MTWTYSGDPGASALDELRFLIGDTNVSSQLLSDEELNYLLFQSSDSTTAAGIEACRRLIAQYARLVDQRTGDIDIKYSQRIDQFNQLIAQLREGMAPVPYMGGISRSDMETVRDDEDRQGPIFAIGQLDNPRESNIDDDMGYGHGGTGGVL